MRHPAIDVQRLANRRRIGLVLGAGGILGCAHGGVIRVLREAEVPIDLVVGASIGSMFGLAVAAQLPTDHITGVARAATLLDIFRFYAGRLDPTRSNPIARLILEAGADRTFEDLPHSFAVLVTDMETGRPTVIDHGPVVPAVRASIALPFVSRPVQIDGRQYMDGGMVDTAPIWVARAMGAEKVITVCLGYNYRAPRFLRRRPWTRPLLERLGRQRSPIAGSLLDQVRFGCRLFAGAYDPPLPAQDADVCIWPDFGGKSPNSMLGADLCYDAGVRAARDALPEIEGLYSTPPSPEGSEQGARAS